MEREIAERFIGKYVGVVRDDSGRDFFSKGNLVLITDTAILLSRNGVEEAIDLSKLRSMRELGHNGEHAV